MIQPSSCIWSQSLPQPKLSHTHTYSWCKCSVSIESNLLHVKVLTYNSHASQALSRYACIFCLFHNAGSIKASQKADIRAVTNSKGLLHHTSFAHRQALSRLHHLPKCCVCSRPDLQTLLPPAVLRSRAARTQLITGGDSAK